MTRSELIQKIVDENPHRTQREIEEVVNVMQEAIVEALVRGDRVELRGFGSFSARTRDARIGRNPKTGEAVRVEAKCVPYFRAGKRLRDGLNANEP